ncbi:MAG TPA: hypothetical protein VH418_01345 [Solirubrobacteraceae bacterium]
MSRNVSGQAYALSVLTPILDGHADELRAHLEGLSEGADSPLARVPGTHIARWVVIGDVVYQGAGQRRRDELSPRLLFSSNFDGDIDVYLERLRTGMAADADAIWGHCRGYPGHADGPAFADWMRAHTLEAALFFAAYGGMTVEQVHDNLDRRRKLLDLTLAGQGLAPADLKARFMEAFPLR